YGGLAGCHFAIVAPTLSLGAVLCLLLRCIAQSSELTQLKRSRPSEAQPLRAADAPEQSQVPLQSLVDNATFGIFRSFIEGDCYEALNLPLRDSWRLHAGRSAAIENFYRGVR